MVMIETFLGMAKYLSPRQDDDWTDRANYLYTPNILLAFSVLISWKQFGGHPIECMFPSKFPGSWEQYAENYCWSQDTYFVEPSEHVELLKAEARYTPERQLSYYQWVPFFLILQAAFFRAPSFLWRYFSNHSGIRIHEVVTKAKDDANIDDDIRQKNIGVLTRHLKKALRFHNRMLKKRAKSPGSCGCLGLPYTGGFISSVYIFTKILYVANVIAQFYLMNFFLGTNKHNWYGLGVMKDLMGGVQWETSGYFPRAAVCDFEVRQVGNIQKYSVQCVLVINIFTEKIFVLLWFWYLLLLLSSVISLLQWFMLLTFSCFSRSFITQHMEISSLDAFDPSEKRTKRDIRRFVHSYLHRDGVLVLRLLSQHAGIVFGSDLVLSLWNAFHGLDDKLSNSGTPPSTGGPSQRKKLSRLSIFGGNDVKTSLIPESPAKPSTTSSSDDSDDDDVKGVKSV